MLRRLEVHNVGRFKSLKTEGDSQFFKKNTYIFGKNTFGKSTLASIFRSLIENKPDYIIGRKRFGTNSQTVKIVPDVLTPVAEYRFTTAQGSWNAEYSAGIIFDSTFVKESVFTQTQQIGQDEQKNIEAFMLGARGVRKLKEIEVLTEKIRSNATTQAAIKTEYSGAKHLLGGCSFEEFLSLNAIENIDEEIAKEQKNLDRMKNAELISDKLRAVRSLLEAFRDYDVSKVTEQLSVNSELLDAHYSTQVNHDVSEQAFREFLHSGSKMRTRTEKECCPFCTQELKSEPVKQFLNTIDGIYNDKYRTLQRSLKESAVVFSKVSFDRSIEEAVRNLSQAGYSLDFDFLEVDNFLERLEVLIGDKRENLAKEIDISIFEGLSSEAARIVSSISSEMAKFEDPSDLKMTISHRLDVLIANRERFTSWREKCNKYSEAKIENDALSESKAVLWDAYKVYANSLSQSILNDINTILRACRCDFEVQKFSFRGNQRHELLELKVNGEEIANTGNESEPTVKNCLSDSDKWILALAFFLTSVKGDTAVKVVVMDDPVSSFDVDRKRVILKEIKRVLDGSDKQLILLTHEQGFFHLLHSEYKSDSDSIFLKFSLDSEAGSDLVECDPDEDPNFMSDYQRWIASMVEAESSNELDSVRTAHANIRQVIEHVLKAKFPIQLTGDLKTIDKMLTRLEQPGGPYATSTPRTAISALLPNLTHHDNSGVRAYPSSALGINDFKNEIRDAFEVVASL